MNNWDKAKSKLLTGTFPKLNINDMGDRKTQSEWVNVTSDKEYHVVEGKKRDIHGTITARKRIEIEGFEAEYHATFCPMCKQFTRKTGTLFSNYLGIAYVHDYSWPE